MITVLDFQQELGIDHNFIYDQFTKELIFDDTKIISLIPTDINSFDEWANNVLFLNKIKQPTLGQFHTPLEIAANVLTHFSSDFITNIINGARFSDPSCGTGSFFIALFELIHKHLDKNLCDIEKKEFIYNNILPKMLGIEIDPVLYQSTKINLQNYFNVSKLPDNILCCGDTLGLNNYNHFEKYFGQFDYVFGNPPWVEAKTLPDNIKNLFQKQYINFSNNLYNAFIFQGLELLKSSGELAYIVPRSFTGGKYYEKLRSKIKNETQVQKISYFSERNGSFCGGKILQERVIFSIKKGVNTNNLSVCNPQIAENDHKTKCFIIETNKLFHPYSNIMILANNKTEFEWLENIGKHPNFEEHGFRFSTGQLVPHRHRNFLRENQLSDSDYPIFYPHHISCINGQITYNLNFIKTKDKLPFAVTEGFKNRDGRKNKNGIIIENNITTIDRDLNSFKKIILCKRRTHKGDKRRFVGIYLDRPELPENYFIDNGLNFIVKDNMIKEAPTLKAFYAILMSSTFEKFFEVISSNTQLNKNDMYLFGIPKVNQSNTLIYEQIEKLISSGFTQNQLDKYVNELYFA